MKEKELFSFIGMGPAALIAPNSALVGFGPNTVKDSRKRATHDARKIPTLGYDISEGSGFFSSPAFCFSRSRYDSPLILITTL